MKDWLLEFGFSKNPFFLESVDIEKHGEKAFVNRESIKEIVKRISNVREGKYMLLGDLGEGKSSGLNYADHKLKEEGFESIKISLLPCKHTRDVYIKLLEGIGAIDLKKENRERIIDVLEREYKEKITTYHEKQTSGEVGAVLNLIIGKITSKSGKREVMGESITTSKSECMELQKLLEMVTKELSGTKTVFIIDDLDKFELTLLLNTLRYVIDSLPDSIPLITTGDKKTLDISHINKAYYDHFTLPHIIFPIDTPERLKEFIMGRVRAYSPYKEKIASLFNDKAIEILSDRTNGNLREAFRYCQQVMSDIKEPKVLEEDIIRAIRKVDESRIIGLNEDHITILKIFSKEESFSIYDAEKYVGKSKTHLNKLVEELIERNLTYKVRIGTRGKGYTSLYRVPHIVGSLIKFNQDTT